MKVKSYIRDMIQTQKVKIIENVNFGKVTSDVVTSRKLFRSKNEKDLLILKKTVLYVEAKEDVIIITV